MKRLWAPWRMVYIDGGSKEQGCIFCTKFHDSDLRAGLVLAHTRHTVVMLNKYPYNNGHLLLAPKRHESTLANLPSEEFIDLNQALRHSVEIMREAVRLNARRARLEASGNVTLENVRQIAETGVDFISVGALTHSAKVFDVSLNWIE